MNFFVQFLELIAFLVPDFFLLGLNAATFLSLYCIAKACGLTGTADPDAGFGIALTLAYLATVTVNVWSYLLIPARPKMTAMSSSESQSAENAFEFPSRESLAQSVEQGSTFTPL